MKNILPIRSSFNPYFLTLCLIAVIYLFFPGNNPFSEDSVAYANNVKYGEELFWPHHLLYSAFNYCLFQPIMQIFPALESFRFMQAVNGVAGLCCLFVLYRIVIQLTGDSRKAAVWTFFTASCFGVIRFCVEIEAYIIPIFFSLISSLCYLKFLLTTRSRYILFCSLSASMACLFHQIHLFWGIGLFFGFLSTGKIRQIALYAFPTVSVLLVYSSVMVFYEGRDFSFYELWKYLSDYYHSDDAKMGIGFSNFMLTPVSFFRTFFQLHGIIVDVLRLIPAFWFVFPVVMLLLGFSVFSLKGLRFKGPRFTVLNFETTHLLIFALQLAFAFFSAGNAEFMGMLPFLIPLFIYAFFDFKRKTVTYFSAAMLIWNFCFSVFPNYYFDYYNDSQLLRVIRENPDNVFILAQRNIVVEKHYYYTGCYEDDRLIHNKKEDILRLQSANRPFYTDILSKRMPFNRSQLINNSADSFLVFKKHSELIRADLGDYFVDEVIVSP